MKITKSISFLSFAVAALMVFSLTACGSGTAQNATSTADSSISQSNNTEVSSSSAEEEFNPLAKYDNPIEVTVGRSIDSTVKFKDGESLDNNIWSRTIEDELGVKIKYAWIVNSDQYTQKVNVIIASNDFPDIFSVNATQLKTLADANKLEDLTDLYNKYATPTVKKMFDWGPRARKASTFGGKLLAIQPNEDYISSSNLIWLRYDWLTKLNLPEPKTMDDVLNIIQAFATKDPDGNGKNDTFGIAVSKSLAATAGYGNISGFCNGYHAYPGIWIKDSNDKLVYGSIQPEMRTALLKLQELCKQGFIDKEFGVKDDSKLAEDIGSGKIGLEYGHMWNALYPLQSNKDKDPKADWRSYPVVSIDDKTALTQQDCQFNDFTVEKKGIQNPEVIMKLLDIGAEKAFGPNAQANVYWTDKEDGTQVFKYLPVLPKQNIMGPGYVATQARIKDAFSTNDPSKLNSEEKGNYDNIVKYKAGDNKFWGFDATFGEVSAWATIADNYDKNKTFMRNEFYGAPTPTMVQKKSTLEKMESEILTRVILGSSISEYDKFVTDWSKLGGEQITNEVNAWYQTQK